MRSPGAEPLRLTVRGRGWRAGHKTGLGGSAASTAAVLGALAAAAGHDVSSPSLRRALLPTAADLHRAHQHGRGSGADVAASVHGGWVDYRMLRGTPHAEPASAPPGLRLAVAWSGLACDTATSIDTFQRMGGGTDAGRFVSRTPTRRSSARSTTFTRSCSSWTISAPSPAGGRTLGCWPPSPASFPAPNDPSPDWNAWRWTLSCAP
ncbi:hypothetical protein ACFVFS_14100 [Kitasatospora sp. NPDC057692]|uniref:GHMP family kinase ATP-binding protein n=1 Tax=Kitasatospora sp. NPDC057692 TaxID=3346215 RepID=UPI0036989088